MSVHNSILMRMLEARREDVFALEHAVAAANACGWVVVQCHGGDELSYKGVAIVPVCSVTRISVFNKRDANQKIRLSAGRAGGHGMLYLRVEYYEEEDLGSRVKHVRMGNSETLNSFRLYFTRTNQEAEVIFNEGPKWVPDA